MNDDITVTELEGDLTAENLRIGIAVSRFNDLVTEKLLDGALDTLDRHCAGETDVDVARVPGSWELPLAARRMAEREEYDAIICLGAVIRGETPHFEYVSSEATKGIGQVSRESGIPVTFGLLTTDTTEQAIDRAGVKQGNKGAEAAQAAIEMTNLLGEL